MDRTFDRTVFKAITKSLTDLMMQYYDKEMLLESAEVDAFNRYLEFRFVNNQIWIDDENPNSIKAYIKPLGKTE